MRLAVLLSSSGSNLQALLDAQVAGTLGNAEIVLVVADRPDAYGVQRALQHGIATVVVPLQRPRNATARAEWEQRLIAIVAAFAPDLLLLSGFMRVLSPQFLARFPGRIINQHPALLPDNSSDTVTTSNGTLIPALRGAHVVTDAMRLRLTVTGCTVHYVTATVDDGPVLARAEVPVLPDDDEATLHERIKIAERELVVSVVQRLSAGDVYG